MMESVPGPHPEVYKSWRPATTVDPVTGQNPTFAIRDA